MFYRKLLINFWPEKFKNMDPRIITVYKKSEVKHENLKQSKFGMNLLCADNKQLKIDKQFVESLILRKFID